MTIFITLGLLAAIFPLLIYVDFRNKRTADNDPDVEFNYNGRATSFVMMFTPLLALFYANQFWTTLLYMMPLYTYFCVLMVVANRKSWYPFNIGDLYIASSGLTTAIVAYYIWFHEGILGPEASNTASTSTHTTLGNHTNPAIWPYYLFGILLTAILVSTYYEKYSRGKKTGLASSLIAPAAVLFPLLPLFIESYWWGMLVSIGALIVIVPYVSSLLPLTARGGMSFVIAYIFMMAATLSIILYAILF